MASEVPAITDEMSQQEPAAKRASRPPRPARILVVDDESQIRRAIRACLEAAGCVVLEAADGLEAMDTIIHAAPDVMILDLAMPTLDGVRTIEHLQGVHGQLKPRIIILTAFGSAPARLKTLGMGASVFLEKPVTPQALRDAVRQVLSAPTDEPGGIPIDWSTLLREEQLEPDGDSW
jgi:DNA-binding response OmpR family regulator